MKTYPKGTTKEQWDQYEMDLKNHNSWCDSRLGFAQSVIELVKAIGPEEAFAHVKKVISETRSMDAPNKPGYYTANND